MDAFLLVCLIAVTPETLSQKEMAEKCNKIYTTQSTCLEQAEQLTGAFDYAENRRSEGTFAGCIRTTVTEGQLLHN